MTGNPKQPSPQAVMWSFALPKSVDQLHEHVRREVFRRIHIIGTHSDELVDRRVVMQINLAKRILLTTMRSCKETVFVGNVRQSQEDHVWSDVVLSIPYLISAYASSNPLSFTQKMVQNAVQNVHLSASFHDMLSTEYTREPFVAALW